MSVVPQIYNGLGLKNIKPVAYDGVREIPNFGMTNGGLTKPSLKLNWYKTSNLESPGPLKQSVLLTNQGGARGVMPCKGAASVGSVWGVQRVLRRPNIPYQGGMYPSQGFARNQPKGLASNAQRNMNGPLLPLADSFNAGLISTLGQPA